MKIHLRADSTNKEHTRFTIFIDGKNCGDVCMGTREARAFSNMVENGMEVNRLTNFLSGDVFLKTGFWNGDEEHEKN